jgi:hypothetical protein
VNGGDATNRSRYDTQALVVELKRERRNAIVLGTIGVAIALTLGVLYFSLAGDDEGPSTPAGHAATLAREGPKPPTVGAGVAPGPTSPDATSPSAAPPAITSPGSTAPATSGRSATIKALLTKKTTLWIDGKPTVHGNDVAIELAAGPHEIKLKLGKKTAAQKIDVKAEDEYELRFDPKNEKAQLKKVK